jgi:hypothetical protein
LYRKSQELGRRIGHAPAISFLKSQNAPACLKARAYPPKTERQAVRIAIGSDHGGVAQGEVERGILVCTNGIGMSILANKFPGIRAALVHDLNGARMSREHNNSNILVLGGGITERSLAEQILDIWLNTPFAGGRHQRRIDKIAEVERELGSRIQDRPKY